MGWKRRMGPIGSFFVKQIPWQSRPSVHRFPASEVRQRQPSSCMRPFGPHSPLHAAQAAIAASRFGPRIWGGSTRTYARSAPSLRVRPAAMKSAPSAGDLGAHPKAVASVSGATKTLYAGRVMGLGQSRAGQVPAPARILESTVDEWNYEQIIDEVARSVGELPDRGAVASYIPELAGVNPDKFGLAICCVDGRACCTGDARVRFSLQSIAKVFALALALSVDAEEVWRRVGVEPSGDPFNSLVQLEYERGVPRNPMINAGALVVCDILNETFDDPLGEVVAFVRTVCGDRSVDFDRRVAQSEMDTAFRNRSLLNLMRGFGNIRGDVEEVLWLYTRICALAMDCEQLARAYLFLADHGSRLPQSYAALSASRIKRINAIMLTSGFYDEAGEFAFRVGLPGKSGVGGGIAAVCPDRFAVAAWSPRLGDSGNSVRGTAALAGLVERTDSSIF